MPKISQCCNVIFCEIALNTGMESAPADSQRSSRRRSKTNKKQDGSCASQASSSSACSSLASSRVSTPSLATNASGTWTGAVAVSSSSTSAPSDLCLKFYYDRVSVHISVFLISSVKFGVCNKIIWMCVCFIVFLFMCLADVLLSTCSLTRSCVCSVTIYAYTAMCDPEEIHLSNIGIRIIQPQLFLMVYYRFFVCFSLKGCTC